METNYGGTNVRRSTGLGRMCACKVEWTQNGGRGGGEVEDGGRRHRDGFGLCSGSAQPGKGNRPNPSFVCPSIRPRQTSSPLLPPRILCEPKPFLSCSVAWGWSRKWTRSIDVPSLRHGFISFISLWNSGGDACSEIRNCTHRCTYRYNSGKLYGDSNFCGGGILAISVDRWKEFNVSIVCQNWREKEWEWRETPFKIDFPFIDSLASRGTIPLCPIENRKLAY